MTLPPAPALGTPSVPKAYKNRNGISMKFENMPARVAALPRDHRGYPVPWFVAWVDGKPVFPCADGKKLALALREERCWVCGDSLGGFRSFVIGPMCTVNGVSAEPPSHRDCATFSARVCPFLANPSMKRVPTPHKHNAPPPPGVMLERNPGVCCVWTVRSTRGVRAGYAVERVPNGVLFRLAEPASVEWFAQGRTATREEVLASVESGLPALQAMADAEGDEAPLMLAQMVDEARKHFPAADILAGATS